MFRMEIMKMDIKEVGKAMQEIEFILFTVKNGDIGKLHAGEAEKAHMKAKLIMEKYLLPLNAFEE
jgi:hypothetical protein